MLFIYAVRNTYRIPKLLKPERNSQLDAIEINLMLNEETRFLTAITVVCNELRARTDSSSVGFGLYRCRRCKLLAISNTKKFNRREPRLLALGFAMEECAEQDEEVQAPRPEAESFIAYEHEKYLKIAKEEFLLSIPLRINGHVFGVISLERSGLAYSADELQALRMIADLAARRLHDLLASRNLGIAKRWTQFREFLCLVFGVRYTWWKLGVLALLGTIAVLILFPWFYRIDASFELKASQSLELTARVDGFIKTVAVQPGQVVRVDDVLLELDTTDLMMMMNESLAKIGRLEADGARARAEGNLMGNRLLLAEVREEEARLEKLRYQLKLTSLRAPWDAYVIEGDLQERVGSPVSRGDTLFRLSELDALEVRLEIPERSIHELGVEGSQGELAFASRPDIKYRFVIDQIEPIGVVKPEGTVFIASARIEGDAANWWRPGMSGLAKIDVGERPLIWVLSHRIIDYIRLKLWI